MTTMTTRTSRSLVAALLAGAAVSVALGVIGTQHQPTYANWLTVLVSVPVAYNCLWSLGFQHYDNRVLAHSLLGCAVYGALVAKVFAVHATGQPRWLLPVAGGLLFTLFIGLVLTSAVWYVNTNGWPTGSGY